MKPTRMLLPFFFASLALAGCNARNAQRIAVIQLGTHTSLNEINDAVQAKLKASGNYEIVYKKRRVLSRCGRADRLFLKRTSGPRDSYRHAYRPSLL